MLADLAGFLTDFVGLCLRGAFGRNADGAPDPDQPTNRWAIFFYSLVLFAVLSGVGALAALFLANSFTAVWVTAGIIFGIGLLASIRAAFV